MKVITISEENHGLIGLATSLKAAWRFIFENVWFSAYEEVWDAQTGEFIPVAEAVGKKAEDITDDELIDWLLDSNNARYDTCFTFNTKEIWEVE